MKRFTDEEKRQIGLLIHYYRNQYFRSRNKQAENYKQVEFCRNICSQTQLSRIENGDIIKDQEIYEQLMEKLNLDLDKINSKDLLLYDAYIDNLLLFRNDDSVMINYNEYVSMINDYQNIFKKNIIYTHYNYALEFIIMTLNESLLDAKELIEDVEGTLEILPPKLLILTLQTLGSYYQMLNNNSKANKFYLLALEHMHKNNIKAPIIYLDIAYNFIKLGKYFISLENLGVALKFYENTLNNSIIERIYHYYGIIYLRNRYYDDSINFFNKAIEYCEDKPSSLTSNLIFISICFYFKGELKKAIEYIEKSDQIIPSEKHDLFKAIYQYKLTKIKEKYNLEHKIYNKIIKLYYADKDLEEYFEANIKNLVSKLTDDLNIVIIRDVYHQYKEENKYKKALLHLEEYNIY